MKLTTQAALALALPAAVQASRCRPSPPSSDGCPDVDDVNRALHDYPSASAFCSSFLDIPTVTKTDATTVTQATTVSDVLTSTVTPVVTVFATTTETTSLCNVDLSTLKRREAPHTTPTKPTPTAAGLPDCLHPFPTSKISKACSCLHLPTPTVTVTQIESVVLTSLITAEVTETAAPSTTTETVTAAVTVPGCPLPTICDNAGLEWEYLLNHSGPNEDPEYSNFLPDDYKNLQPLDSGVTSSIGWDSTTGPDISIYGSGVPAANANAMFSHRGYIYAHVTGTYKFDFASIDDVVWFWIGNAAYSGWSVFNANGRVSFPQTQLFQRNFQAGTYYPVRFMFAQDSGDSIFQLRVTAPDGKLILGDDTTASPYVVRFSCDETAAPKYPDWQHEPSAPE